MKEKDPIDKLFARQLSGNRFEMRPEDWQAALEKIDAQKRRKRKLGLWLFAGLAGSMVMLWFWLEHPASEVEPIQIRTAEETPSSPALRKDEPEELFLEKSTKDDNPIRKPLDKALLLNSDTRHSNTTSRKMTEQGQLLSESSSLEQPELLKGHWPTQESAGERALDLLALADNHSIPLYKSFELLPGRMFSGLESRHSGIRMQKLTTPVEGAGQTFEPLIGIGLSFGSLFNIGSGGLWQGIQTGVMTTYQFRPKWGLQLGLLYGQNHTIGGYSQLEFQSEYDFGSITRTLGMHGDTRHYLAIPLALHFYRGRWSVFAGVEPSYTLGIEGTVQEITLMPTLGTRSNKVQEVVQAISEGWLPTGPYVNWNVRTIAGMRYQVNKGFFVQGTLGYQWKNDLKNDPESLQQVAPGAVSFGLGVQIMIEQ